MKAKILLLDLDGVLNKSDKLFSEIYAEKFGIDPEVMIPFFKTQKKLANLGKADLKEQLNKIKDEWKWEESVEELLKYWFKSDLEIDEEMISCINKIRGTGIKIFLATDQEKYRTEYIWDFEGLSQHLDGKYVSYEIGYEKSDPEFFSIVTKELEVEPQEIVFFDDSESKVNSAKNSGINAFLYTDFESFENKIKDLGLL